MIKVLHSFLEALPFLKTGGCADVIGAVARYIDKEKFDCRVIMPDFVFNRENTRQAAHLLDVDVEFEGKIYQVEMRAAEAHGAIFYFLKCDEMFSNPVIFTQDEAQLTRYRFYQYAVLEAVRAAGFRPDIIHGHDWESGLECRLIREPRFREFYENTKTILCIHNLIWQGEGDLETGLRNADVLLTVSDTYRREIMTPEFGCGMEDILRQRQDSLYAIRNGVDCGEFSPDSDSMIRAAYNSPEGKKPNKRFLQESRGLEVGDDRFVIGMVTRLYRYKGMDLLLEAADELMKIPSVQLALLGNGPENYESFYEALAAKYPGRIAAMTFFDAGETMRSVYAGSDALLMPSKTEPCGISQMIAMRYGTVPIVRATGGLRETVVPGVTGFAFENYDAGEMLETISQAEHMFSTDREEWNRLAARAMAADNSWENRIPEYEKLYVNTMNCRQKSV